LQTLKILNVAHSQVLLLQTVPFITLTKSLFLLLRLAVAILLYSSGSQSAKRLTASLNLAASAEFVAAAAAA
jgi:hypothetical protein